MDSAQTQIDWQSDQSDLFLSPYLDKKDQNALNEIYQKHYLPHHFFIASSGSSRGINESIKLIAVSKTAILKSAEAVNQHLRATPKDIWGLALPTFHVGGLGILARGYLTKSSIKTCIEAKWDPDFYFQKCQNEKVTLSALVPTQVFDLVQLGKPCPSSIRAIIIGGAALSEELYFKARKLGYPLLPSYGMTEVCSQIATADLESLNQNIYPRLQILPHCHVKTDSENHFLIQSDSLMSGFGQKINSQIKWTEFQTGSWYPATDKGEIVHNSIQVWGREEAFVKILGEGVSLDHLRDRISIIIEKTNPKFVTEFALIAEKDERRGYNLVLIVTSKLNGSKIQSDFNSQSKSVDQIGRVVVVDQIPRSELGKILYSQIKI